MCEWECREGKGRDVDGSIEKGKGVDGSVENGMGDESMKVS